MCLDSIRPIHIYVAGPIGPQIKSRQGSLASLAIAYLHNIRTMVLAAVELLHRGFMPFCPALDMLFFLIRPDEVQITEGQIKNYSLQWLLRCDAVLVLPNWQQSEGTKKEIEVAEKYGIPVYYGMEELSGARI